MHRVFLFGSRDLVTIPPVIEQHLQAIMKETNGEVEFIVGDASGVDSGFHKVLPGIGARSKTQIYCMGHARHNTFELPVKSFNTYYDAENKRVTITDEQNNIVDEVFDVEKEADIQNTRQYYEFKDKQMCKDCTFAVCYWDGKSKGTFNNITR